MYYYAPDSNRSGKRAGVIAIVLYAIAFAVACLTANFKVSLPEESDGILIDFGDGTDGYGEQNVTLSQTEPAPSSAASAEDDYLTQDTEEAPAIVSAREPDRSSRRETSHEDAAAGNDSRAAQPTHEVNRRALFPGRSMTTDNASQGATVSASGNAGHESGGDGAADGTGIGSEGISFSLAGRRPVGSLPAPTYDSDAQGRIVIEITVDAQGRVQTAAFNPLGSTTQDAALRNAALRAARAARFTASENNAVQTGTITYVFRLQ